MRQLTVKLLGAAIVILAVLWALSVHRWMGLNPFKGQYLYVLLALSIVVVFVQYPLSVNNRRLSLLVDLPIAFVGAATALWIAWDFGNLIEQANLYQFDLLGQVLAAIMIAVIIEGVRRTAGWSLAIIVTAAVLISMFAAYLPEPMTGRAFRAPSFLYKMGYLEGNILGAPLAIVGSVVIAFVLMGSVLQSAGGGQFFSDLAAAAMGRSRGGSAKIAVAASGLFGSISGSAVSNVVSTGMVTIPMMRRAGYAPHTAAGLEAVASTGGQLVPPVMGAAAFLMAVTAEVDYSVVVIAAIIPAFLYYLALYLQIDLIAGRDGIKGMAADEAPSAWYELRHGWIFIVPFVTLIFGLFALNQRPEYAALISTAILGVLLIILGYKGKRPTVGTLMDAFEDTAKAAVGIILIAAAAGIVIGSLNNSGVLFKITEAIIDVGETNLVMLLGVAAILCIILGMGMPTVGVYALLSTLIAAPLVKLGIDKVAAHMFVLYFGMMSLVTPPVAVASFAAASLAGTPAMKTGWAASKLAWSAYVIPFVFVANPALILNGTLFEIAFALARAIIGVWLVSAFVVGYLNHPLGALLRTGYLLLGTALLLPTTVFDEAVRWPTAVASLILGVVVLVYEFGKRNKEAAAHG